MKDQIFKSENEVNRIFVQLMQQSEQIYQLNTRFISYDVDHLSIPTTVNKRSKNQEKNCYVVSPTTQVIWYSKDELERIPSKITRIFGALLIGLLKIPCRVAQLDWVQILNNYCLSTNFYGASWQNVNMKRLMQVALAESSQHALMLRSLNHDQNRALILQLSQEGWLPVVSRQVYLFLDKKRWQKRHNSKIDQKLLAEKNWYFQDLSQLEQDWYIEAESLYRKLYIEKYSKLNIEYSHQYLRSFSQAGLLKIYGLFHHETMLGVVGFFGVENQLTVPIVGYDTQRPMNMAIYRRLIAFAIKFAMDNDLQLNLSSGASTFKKLRGGQASIEYSYVYIAHLPWLRRKAWQCLSWLSLKVYLPILEKFEL